MTRSAEAQQLSLGVLTRSRKPNELALPIHPAHFVRTDHRVRLNPGILSFQHRDDAYPHLVRSDHTEQFAATPTYAQ